MNKLWRGETKVIHPVSSLLPLLDEKDYQYKRILRLSSLCFFDGGCLTDDLPTCLENTLGPIRRHILETLPGGTIQLGYYLKISESYVAFSDPAYLRVYLPDPTGTCLRASFYLEPWRWEHEEPPDSPQNPDVFAWCLTFSWHFVSASWKSNESGLSIAYQWNTSHQRRSDFRAPFLGYSSPIYCWTPVA